MRITSSAVRALLIASLLASFAAVAAEKAAPAKPGKSLGSASEADKAWDEVQKSGKPPQPPETWQETRPSQEEIDTFKAAEGKRLVGAADKAKEFQAKFPQDPRAEEAKSKEYELLQLAARMGNTDVLSRLDTLDEAKLKDPNISEDDRFQVRASGVQRRAVSKLPDDMAGALAELEKGARGLVKEFPSRPEGYQMLLEVASNAESDKARLVAKDLAASDAPEQVKEAAKGLLRKFDRVGKPLSLEFTAVDGSAVDLQKLRGKVVLVDFWATWCGPCVKELPSVRAAYDKLHPKGFEILGISFDQSKEKLLGFVEKEKMPWPQYFDGKGWSNEFGKEFGIQSIPTMWLVDKKGNLRDLNARQDLVAKVEKLLAENP